MAGLYCSLYPVRLPAYHVAGDTLDNSNGIVWDMAWLSGYTNGGLTVTPGIGVQWNSQNEYYSGVSRKESARSSMRGYNPNDSWSPYLELTPATTSSATGVFTVPRAIPVCLMKLLTARWWINPGLA